MLVPAALAVCAVVGAPQEAGRPALSGAELVHLTADGRLRIHYTLEGADALVDALDVAPKNGVPDPVDWAEAGAARMLDVFAGEDGWPLPPPDEGLGGDERVDLYLRALDSNGYAHLDRLPSGGLSLWMEVDPEVVGLGRAIFESVVGHETHHLLELAVSEGAVEGWILEATATYAQYLLAGAGQLVDLARHALWGLRLLGAAQPLDQTGGQFEYAGMVWVKYLVDRAGGARPELLELWRAMARERGWARGTDAWARARLGMSLDEAVADHAVWNWFACENDDGFHYDRDTAGCTIGLGVPAARVESLPAAGDALAVGERGSTYVELLPDCTSGELELRVRPTERARVSAIGVVPRAESEVTAVDAAAGVETIVTLGGWNRHARVVLAVTNLGDRPADVHWSAAARGAHAPADVMPPPLALHAPAAITVGVGERAPVTVTAELETCDDGRDVTASVTWTSSDESIAIARGGSVEGVRAGAAEIVATLGGVSSAPIAVTVVGSDSGCAIGGRGGSGWALWTVLAWLVMTRCGSVHWSNHWNRKDNPE